MKLVSLRMALAVLLLAAAAPVVSQATPVDDARGCDPIDPTLCLLPFPNDYFTVADATTVTGRRVNISPLATPRALQGAKPIFTDETNRNDGFSPGSLIVTFVPGLDLPRTWGTQDLPENRRDHIADLGRYAAPDAPMVIINATTGQRHPFWSELDTHPQTGANERVLLLRPAVNFDEATRYIVLLRNLRSATGALIPADPAFAAYRAGSGENAARQADITRIMGEAAAFEAARGDTVDTSSLNLAWEFTVASWQNLAGRALHMRDQAFAGLGDANLADKTVAGKSPVFRVDRVQKNPKADTAAFIHGTVEVPNYLIGHAETPELYDATGAGVTTEIVSPVNTPHARLYYPPGSDLPAVNPVQPVFQAHFTCRVPKTASPTNKSRPVLMGHGLLGQRIEVGWSSGDLLTREYNVMYCGTEWLGMSFGDIPQAVSILLDPSLFASMPDRAQQGYLNFMFLGRAMIHPSGFSSDPAFQIGGQSVIDTDELFYDGNSQGGIMGGALTALSPDFTKANLGVVGMNYSTLLNRSIDWEGEYGEVYYASIPDKKEQQLVFSLMQMLWDRAEGQAYAHHMTDDPYPNTPSHQVMLHVAFGDFQVANVSAEVEARTIGARLLQTSLASSRHWSVDPAFQLEVFDTDGSGALLPHEGSALVYWDSGNLVPPNGNLAPIGTGGDPHGDPRSTPASGRQRSVFFDTGLITDVNPGSSYCTHRFARVASQFPVGGDGKPVCPVA